MGVATAVTAAATLGGAAISASSANKAAKAQSQAINQAADKSAEVQNRALDFVINNPQRIELEALGRDSLPYIRGLLGLPDAGQGASGQAALMGSTAAGAYNPTGADYASYVTRAPSLNGAYNSLTPAQRGYIQQRGYSPDAEISLEEYGRFHAGEVGDRPTPGSPQFRRAIAEPQGAKVSAVDPRFKNPDGSFNVEKYVQSTPGYKFRFNEGSRAINAGFAKSGNLLSGARAKALTRYGQDYGSGEYTNALNRLWTAASGGNSAFQTAANAQQNNANSLSNIYTRAGEGVGDARASGYLGQGAAWGNALGTIGGWAADRIPGGGGRG